MKKFLLIIAETVKGAMETTLEEDAVKAMEIYEEKSSDENIAELRLLRNLNHMDGKIVHKSCRPAALARERKDKAAALAEQAAAKEKRIAEIRAMDERHIVIALAVAGEGIDDGASREELAEQLVALEFGEGIPAPEPAADEPAADESAADEPAADEPAADEPAADEPAGGIEFASDAAAHLALMEGITEDDLAGLKPSSEKGFTKSDIQAYVDARDEEE